MDMFEWDNYSAIGSKKLATLQTIGADLSDDTSGTIFAMTANNGIIGFRNTESATWMHSDGIRILSRYVAKTNPIEYGYLELAFRPSDNGTGFFIGPTLGSSPNIKTQSGIG
jgi:hypothetical protein